MNEERKAFSRRLAEAMREAGYEPRPNVLHKLFNSRYRGPSVAFQSASRWLNGRSIPEQDKLQVIARLVGVEPHVLRYGAVASRVAEPRPAWLNDLKPGDREAIDAYFALAAPQRKAVRELIAALAAAAREKRS